MSFEGRYQCWCHNGHYWREPYSYDEYGKIKRARCPQCQSLVNIYNLVDDTNCDNWGLIIDTDKPPVFLLDNFPTRLLGKEIQVRCCNGHLSKVTIKNLMFLHACHHYIDDEERGCGAPFSEVVDELNS